MKTKTTLGILSVLVALWFGWGAIYGFIWSIHYYYWGVPSGTVFTVDGVQMNFVRIFLPVAIRFAIAGGAAWFALKMLKRRHADA